jgi:hypothetical protein
MRLKGKIKLPKPPRKKKLKKTIEWADVCDYCGNKLRTSHPRTIPGIMVASCDGSIGRSIGNDIKFFCSKECYFKYNEGS